MRKDNALSSLLMSIQSCKRKHRASPSLPPPPALAGSLARSLLRAQARERARTQRSPLMNGAKGTLNFGAELNIDASGARGVSLAPKTVFCIKLKINSLKIQKKRLRENVFLITPIYPHVSLHNSCLTQKRDTEMHDYAHDKSI